MGRSDDSANVMRFERASVREFANALQQSMGLSLRDAEVDARSVGSSPSIWHIRNLFSNAQQPTLPVWAEGQQSDAVVAAVFAGAWREDSLRDAAVVSELAGMGEAQLSGALSTFARRTTPLLDLIGPSRFVIAPTAAFVVIRRSIARRHIARLSKVVASVFQGISTAVEDRWHGVPDDLVSRNPQEEVSRNTEATTLERRAM